MIEIEDFNNPQVKKLPNHLRQYIVSQNYHHYTPVDHAVWRYVMRQNYSYLKDVAYYPYIKGLSRAGLSIEYIPDLQTMNDNLAKIGWGAVTVDGFIPPVAFMEFQAYQVLVIAADIRQINHIAYTPAPDIIHESAGHAPIIADEAYNKYLSYFGSIGAKAMFSSKDYELYEAIRHLSILKEDAKHPEANYELAFTYSVLKEYDKSIKHCDLVIKSKTDITHLAYAIKGACEDYQGKPDKAIKTFKDGIKFNPNYHSLYYSLALTSYNQRKFKEAEEALIDGIKVNPYHTSSHMLMGFLKFDQKERSKSLLAFFYFLLLEPEGNRANQVFKLIDQQQKQGVTREDNKNITVNISSDFDKNDFGTAEMMLSLMEASKETEVNENKSDFEIFSNTNTSFFKILGEQRKGKKGFFWDFYVDFFNDLIKDSQIYEAYSHHIYQPINYNNNK